MRSTVKNSSELTSISGHRPRAEVLVRLARLSVDVPPYSHTYDKVEGVLSTHKRNRCTPVQHLSTTLLRASPWIWSSTFWARASLCLRLTPNASQPFYTSAKLFHRVNGYLYKTLHLHWTTTVRVHSFLLWRCCLLTVRRRALGADKSPNSGTPPLLKQGSRRISGFRSIVRFLRQYSDGRWDLDANLDEDQTATSTA